MAHKFLRQDSHRHSRLGKNRRKKQVWRLPKGRHSKMRQQRKSYPSMPTIGYATPRKDSGKIQGLSPVLVHNLSELKALSKTQIAILAKIGAKKKLELIKFANENKIKMHNVRGNLK